MNQEKQRILHEALIGFSSFRRYDIEPSIQNCLLFLKLVPPETRNQPLIFLLERAWAYTVDKLCLQIHEAWELLNRELKRLDEEQINGADFEALDRIRHKMVAHKIANSFDTIHVDWYKENFGSYESVFELFERVAEEIEERIHALHKKEKLLSNVGVEITPRPELKESDINQLFDALKEKGLL